MAVAGRGDHGAIRRWMSLLCIVPLLAACWDRPASPTDVFERKGLPNLFARLEVLADGGITGAFGETEVFAVWRATIDQAAAFYRDVHAESGGSYSGELEDRASNCGFAGLMERYQIDASWRHRTGEFGPAGDHIVSWVWTAPADRGEVLGVACLLLY